MVGIGIFLIGLALAVIIAVGAHKLPDAAARNILRMFALAIVLVFTLFSSVRLIGPDEVGIVIKSVGFSRLQGGAYIATGGEQGIQADVLRPGWYFGYWPFIYDVREVAVTVVPQRKVGIIDAADGLPLTNQVIAPEWPEGSTQKMLDARHFLTDGKGHRGTQATVLLPGKYPINTELFRVTMVDWTEVVPGEVAVLKANFGTEPTVAVRGVGEKGQELVLAGEGEMGIRAKALLPTTYPLNTVAYTPVEIWTKPVVAHYTAHAGTVNQTSAGAKSAETEEREITVRTSDGFTFPVDVRVEYHIDPANAPLVVATTGDDESEHFRNILNSAVRAIFRNNAETVRALDYVQQRSHQEEQSLAMLKTEMSRFGVTVTAVRIGNVGDEKTLGTLLKTQTDREIAKQELVTYQEQQKAAEQKRMLSRATQEAEEEKRLATAAYAVKIAEEDKRKRLIEAEAEAQSIAIKAKAQADAYQQIAQQIGTGNAAMIEILKIVGERGIQITPRVMITGGGGVGGGLSGGGGDSGTAALVGTILDQMVKDDEKPEPATPRTSLNKP